MEFWIDTRGELPANGNRVLATVNNRYTGSKFVTIILYANDTWNDSEGFELPYMYEVTAWAHLPHPYES